MKKICHAKMADNNDIDDIISETYLAFCEHCKKHGLPDNPTAWLYSVLNRRINNKYREVYKNTKNNVHLDEIQNLSFEVDFEEELLKNVSIDELKTKIISKLTNDEYNLYELIYEKGTKYAEIAKKYSTTESAVKQRHYRLCSKIKKLAKTLCSAIQS